MSSGMLAGKKIKSLECTHREVIIKACVELADGVAKKVFEEQ